MHLEISGEKLASAGIGTILDPDGWWPANDEVVVTAMHEAGHAWSANRRGCSVLRVAVFNRPPADMPDTIGITHISRTWQTTSDYVSVAGPAVETEYLARVEGLNGLTWHDSLEECLMLGRGRHDYNSCSSSTLWREGPELSSLRQDLAKDWSKICRLAASLLARRELDAAETAATLRVPNLHEANALPA